MGFYGNITNTARTIFQFDKIYKNRYEMDLGCTSDGIYIGRYVLVNYETGSSADVYNSNYFCYEKTAGVPEIYTALISCESLCASDDETKAKDEYSTGANSSTVTTTSAEVKYVGASDLYKVDSNSIAKNTIIRIQPGRHFYDISTVDKYIKIINETSYETSDEAAYREYWEIADEDAIDIRAHHAHIVNNVITASDSSELVPDAILLVPAGYAYTTNVDYEFLIAGDINDTTITWTEVNSGDSEYLKNFNIDKSYYGLKRGYDSTVWQKVYTDGVESYVMIAELNTVIPTFDVSGDAPSLIPVAPHFDTDSTNVYYKFHWQPQWGFRPKAASSTLLGPAISQQGVVSPNSDVTLTTDVVNYPSDESVEWKSDLYDISTNTRSTKYFNPKTNTWDDESSKNTSVPAAIYYNKDGFDYLNISYSQDILDETQAAYNKDIAESGWEDTDAIAITPTGLSGNVYNSHGNVARQTAQEDTQELSVMLPSLGNTIAKLWDIAYGGRDTNDSIALTNQRNTKLEWENASGNLERQGLRLVADEGSAYNTAEVNTIAGCINTAHDIIGMIITPIALEEDKNGDQVIKDGELQSIDINVTDLDDNRIYYNTIDNSYYRKHVAYSYDDSAMEYDYQLVDNVIEENFYPELYYVKNSDGTYSPATTYTTGVDYYARILTSNDLYSEVTLSTFDGTKYLYQDYTGSPKATTELMKDYIADSVYQPDRKYYTVDSTTKYNLDGSYEKDKYFYLSNGDYLLDRHEEPYQDDDGKYARKTYYTIDEDKVINIKDKFSYAGVYVPNVYYYLWPTSETEHEFVLDTEFPALKFYPSTWKEGETNPSWYESNYANQPMAHYRVRLVSEGSTGTSRYVLQESYKSVGKMDEDDYTPGKYYTLNADKEYELSTTWSATDEYFARSATYVLTNSQNIYTTPINLVNFESNTFYKKIIDEEDDTVIGYQVYTMYDIINLMEKLSVDTASVDENDLSNFYVFGATYDLDAQGVPTNIAFSDENGKPYRDAISSNSSFYEADKYHYLVASGDHAGSYILDRTPNLTEGRSYYTLTKVSAITDKTFYESYEYYTKQGNEYVLDKATEQTDGATYYKKDGIYVKEDTSNTLSAGSIWNINAKFVPNTVTLARRTEYYELVALPDFARNINTMNGMILKINRLLESSDGYTREQDTVQGTLNYINDLVAQFGKMASQDFVIVDDYGRLRSVETKTTQSDSLVTKISKSDSELDASYSERLRHGVTADIYQQVDSIDDMEDQWITVNINGGLNSPAVQIHHNYQPVKDTTSTSNKNGNGDTLNLYTPIVDKMGHVVGKNTETVTLPYSYKTFQDSETTVGTSAADSTQDTFVFKGDSWIKPVVTNDLLTISHIGPVFVAHTDVSDVTPNFGDTFSITDLTFDDKGHFTSSGIHTVKIPSGSYTNTATSGGTGVITGIGFTVSSGAITSTSNYLGAITLGSYTAPDNMNTISASSISASTALNTALSTLDKRIMDEEKARADAIAALDVEGTTSFGAGKTISTWSEEDGKVSITSQDISISSSQINDVVSKYYSSGSKVVNGSAITDALATLTGTVTGEEGFIQTISEENGKIEATRVAISTSDLSDSDILVTTSGTFTYDTTATVDDSADKTIAWLFAKVAQLESRLAALEPTT